MRCSQPGWRGLAYQLDTARTTPPGCNCVLADSSTKPEEVDSALDLRMYAAALATDFARDRREHQAKTERDEWAGDGGPWAHSTLHDWDASWAAWAGANSPFHEQLEPVTWRFIALQPRARLRVASDGRDHLRRRANRSRSIKTGIKSTETGRRTRPRSPPWLPHSTVLRP